MRKEEKEPTRNLVMHPSPSSEQVMNFLDHVFFGDFEQPQKLVLCAVSGPSGQRMGAMIREFSFKPGEKPSKEQLVELSNLCVQLFQDQVDALSKTTTFGIHAFHLGRSDRSYARVLIRLAPSGQTTALQDTRGDDDEDSSSRLLLQLLQEERRDRRWTFELTMNALSGLVEQQSERLERMERVVDGAFDRQLAWLKATEETLSQAADRQAKASWESFKREKVALAIDKAISVTEVVLPQLIAARAAKQQQSEVVAANPVGQFLLGVSEEQGAAAFGTILDKNRVSGGVFSPEQFQLLSAIAKESEPDAAMVRALIESIRPEQIIEAQRIFPMSQLGPLLLWVQQHNATNGSVQ